MSQFHVATIFGRPQTDSQSVLMSLTNYESSRPWLHGSGSQGLYFEVGGIDKEGMMVIIVRANRHIHPFEDGSFRRHLEHLLEQALHFLVMEDSYYWRPTIQLDESEYMTVA